MYIQVVRLSDNNKSTIGTMHVNGKFECFTLEDTHNEPKVYGKTRIPAGKYDVKLRAAGGMHGDYSERYGNNHHGMLWLQNVNNFEWVYIHVGNYSADTDGCILVGTSCDSLKGTIGSSRKAYEALYLKASQELLRGQEVTIEII